MRNFFFLCFLVLPITVFCQQKIENLLGFDSEYNSTDSIKKKKEKVGTIDMCRVITLERDTTYIDTSLTIKNYTVLITYPTLPHDCIVWR